MNYACRDDYGALASDTSAWAGIHYFSSREPEEKGPLTWPEGNGWITRRLLERVGANVRSGQMVHRIVQTRRGASVFAGDTEFQSEFIIFAAPTFLAPYLLENFPQLPRPLVDPPVWTFYWAPAEGAPAQNRHLLPQRDWAS